MVVRSAPRAEGAIPPERAGPERASRGGVSLAWFHTNSEGPRRGTSLLGRTRRRVGGLGSMPSPSDRSKPAGLEKNHGVEEKQQHFNHRAKKEPSRSDRDSATRWGDGAQPLRV